jgi:hypothetical protein
MLVAADAVQALLDAAPQTSVRDAVRKVVGSLDALQDAVDCLLGPSTARALRTCLI